MIEALKTGLLGLIVGGGFALFKFTPPSPDNLAGIIGIVGIYSGWVIVSTIINQFI